MADRRLFLSQGATLVATCLAAPLLNLTTGCSPEDQSTESEPLVVPLDMVPVGQRLRVDHQGKPVELKRSENGVTARSLLCTHQGCKVRWHEDEQLYVCPCHEGKFDDQGKPVYGMPTRPLKVFPARVEDKQIFVEI